MPAPTCCWLRLAQVLTGRVFVSERVSTELLGSLGHHRRLPERQSPIESLTDREFSDLSPDCSGKSTKAIATEIGISPKDR
jgi:DNA-binding NarL/FixJ family response regulator